MQKTKTNNNAPPSQRRRMDYLSSRLIVECHPGDGQEPLHLFRWWKRIFELLDLPLYDPNHHIDRTHFRCLCNMFHASLKRMPKDLKGKFTQFPHPNHPSLTSLFRRCYELYEIDPTKAPTIFFIKEGDHEAGGLMVINYAMKIVGAGQDKTTIHGNGFRIEGTKEEGKEVDMQDLTMKGSSQSMSQSGLSGRNGLFFLCTRMTFTQCGFGVWAKNTRGRLINCVITECRLSGIACGPKALIELEGAQTKVDGNVTCGNSYLYGLSTCDTSSRIHLLFPLTQESVSTTNAGGGNYGGKGEIAIVDNDGNTIESINESTEQESDDDY
jgi:hypothetical protein